MAVAVTLKEGERLLVPWGQGSSFEGMMESVKVVNEKFGGGLELDVSCLVKGRS